MSAKYSPGPWRWESGCLHSSANHQVAYGCFGAESSDSYTYCVVEVDNPADARLIAAAPEMLDLLKEVVFEDSGLMVSEQIRALIARVEGT